MEDDTFAEGYDPAGLDALQARIGYRFSDINLLLLSLTHRSWAAEHADCSTNERLEFLGDAVLGCDVAAMCYRNLPDWGEGELTALRKSVVNATALAGLARSIHLGSLIRLGRGEEMGGGADKDSILSDAVEALLGAIYIDGGGEPSRHFVATFFGPLIEEAKQHLDRLDEKSTLQELAARLGVDPPVYQLDSTGPDHEKEFTAEVVVAGISARGTGRSKKAAQQDAAHGAVNALIEQHPELGR